MTKPFRLPYAEFYITNVCNFNCENCKWFNNFAFSGVQKWKDYAAIYQQWSEIMDLDRFVILGGEPLTNPDYHEWLQGILELWPDATGTFLTNGHLLDSKDTELYDIFCSTNGRVMLDIGLHHYERLDSVMAVLQQWLQGELSITREPENLRELPTFDLYWQKSYQAIRDPDWPDCDNMDQWYTLPEHIRQECHDVHGFSPEILSQRKEYKIRDQNGVTVLIGFENYFHQAAMRPDYKNHTFSLHDSDPEQAHRVCLCKDWPHFDKGRLYQCGQVKAFPEFAAQFDVLLTPEDRSLVNGYKAATLDHGVAGIQKFLDDIKKPMPQCKFCPTEFENLEIKARSNAKPKIMKLVNKRRSEIQQYAN